MPEKTEIEAQLKAFVLSEFLPDEDPEALTESTSLIETGILDSIATMKLVAYLEEEYDLSIDAHDMSEFDNIGNIARVVLAKL